VSATLGALSATEETVLVTEPDTLIPHRLESTMKGNLTWSDPGAPPISFKTVRVSTFTYPDPALQR